MTEKLKIAIVGATGYTGGEMVRLLAAHPSVEIAALTSRQLAGRNIADIFPALRGILDMPLIELDMRGIAKKCDAVFLAVPHTQAIPIVAGLVREGTRVVDYSADFRLKSRTTYEHWYQSPHTESVLLSKRVYGLPELYREELMNARLVALPGCYPTGALLALAPAVKHGIIDFKQIVINSMSGVSGAGQTPTAATHFPEIADNVRAYGVTSHRHTPEIDQELSLIAGEKVNALFTPHLVPANRGILTTAAAGTLSATSPANLVAMYRRFYKDAPFVRVHEAGSYPERRCVRGSNYCDIGLAYEKRTRKLIAISAIDNLCKGAAGQAVQCMNIMFDLPEETGLLFGGLTP